MMQDLTNLLVHNNLLQYLSEYVMSREIEIYYIIMECDRLRTTFKI